MSINENVVGKRAKIIWQDQDKLSTKEGVIQEISNHFIEIRTKKRLELILINRILRIEVKGGNKE